jgi:hypothetical protein
MKSAFRLWVTVTIAILMTGCALLTPPLERPVIEEKINKQWFSPASVGTLSLTPERRTVLVNFENKRSCAEPPTEVGMDLARLFSGKAGGKNTVGSGEISLAIASSFQNSVLNKRSQGLQAFLAASYYLCQMYMNGAIEHQQMVKLQADMYTQSLPVIMLELQHLHTVGGATAGPSAMTNLESLLKAAENLKKTILVPDANPPTTPTPAPATASPTK